MESVKMSKEKCPMNSAVSDVQEFNGIARSLERSEVRRRNTNLGPARKDIARRLGITPDAIENFRALRTKVVPNWLMARVRAELVSVLQLEIQNLEHEIQLHKQAGDNRSGTALVAAETQIAAAKQILGGETT
jgi:hypothetical protein